jgi:dihydrofolate reductase
VLDECWRPALTRCLIPKLTGLRRELDRFLWPYNPAEDPAMTEWKLDSLRGAGLHLMGRATYQEMAAVWPSAEGVYAPLMNDIPKVVFSKTARARRVA